MLIMPRHLNFQTALWKKMMHPKHWIESALNMFTGILLELLREINHFLHLIIGR